jgi:transposase
MSAVSAAPSSGVLAILRCVERCWPSTRQAKRSDTPNASLIRSTQWRRRAGLSVASAFDDASRFKSSSSAGAHLGLTPRPYESGEVSRNGRISKHGNKMTRKHLYEAATTLLTRNIGFSTLKAWGLRLAKKVGFKKARVAVARKLAVILHAMWKTSTPFRWSVNAA